MSATKQQKIAYIVCFIVAIIGAYGALKSTYYFFNISLKKSFPYAFEIAATGLTRGNFIFTFNGIINFVLVAFILLKLHKYKNKREFIPETFTGLPFNLSKVALLITALSFSLFIISIIFGIPLGIWSGLVLLPALYLFKISFIVSEYKIKKPE